MKFYQVRCKKCKHMWWSQWDFQMFGWKFECSKCGAKDKDIKLVTDVKKIEGEVRFSKICSRAKERSVGTPVSKSL